MNLIADIADKIAGLSPKKAGEVRQWLKDKYGIEAPGGNVTVEVIEEVKIDEPIAFDVIYEGFDPSKKINIIKCVREILQLSLGDAKTFVESSARTLKASVDKDTAEGLKAKVEAEGGIVSIKAV